MHTYGLVGVCRLFFWALSCLVVFCLNFLLLFNSLGLCHLPTGCIYVLCTDLRLKSDYFPVQLYMVLVTETECVYCAVRTESLDAIQFKFGCATSCAVSCQSLAAKAWVCSQARPWLLVQIITETFIAEYFSFCLSVLFYIFCLLSLMLILVIIRAIGR